MAIDVPVTPPAVMLRYHRRGRPILSGEAVGDHTYGWRGVSSLANHAYAYRVQSLVQPVTCADPDTVVCTHNAVSWVQATQYVPVDIGADVVSVDLIADVEDGEVAIDLDGASIGVSGPVAGRTMHAVSGTVTAGAHRLAVLLRSRGAGVDAYLYSTILLRETILVAGDFPA